ncbi:hypothetical protein GBA52_020844 [Prunus armeniaca]|nr:hypothetical protein GBA52_020844 [Prunus armeniaca]
MQGNWSASFCQNSWVPRVSDFIHDMLAHGAYASTIFQILFPEFSNFFFFFLLFRILFSPLHSSVFSFRCKTDRKRPVPKYCTDEDPHAKNKMKKLLLYSSYFWIRYQMCDNQRRKQWQGVNRKKYLLLPRLGSSSLRDLWGRRSKQLTAYEVSVVLYVWNDFLPSFCFLIENRFNCQCRYEYLFVTAISAIKLT